LRSRKGAGVKVAVITRTTQRGCPKDGQKCPVKAIYEKGWKLGIDKINSMNRDGKWQLTGTHWSFAR
jgi:hypothetical protein